MPFRNLIVKVSPDLQVTKFLPHPVRNPAVWMQVAEMPVPKPLVKPAPQYSWVHYSHFNAQPHPVRNTAVFELQRNPNPPLAPRPLGNNWTVNDHSYPFTIKSHPQKNPAVFETASAKPPIYPKQPAERTLTLDFPFLLLLNPQRNVAVWGASPTPIPPTAKNYPERSLVSVDYPYRVLVHPSFNVAVWDSSPRPIPLLGKNYPERTIALDFPFAVKVHPSYNVAVWETQPGFYRQRIIPINRYNEDIVLTVPSIVNTTYMSETPTPRIPGVNRFRFFVEEQIIIAARGVPIAGFTTNDFSVPKVVLISRPSTDATFNFIPHNSVSPGIYEQHNYGTWIKPVLRQLWDMQDTISWAEPNPSLDVGTWEQRENLVPPLFARNYPERTLAKDYPFRIAPYIMLNPAVWSGTEPRTATKSLVRFSPSEEFVVPVTIVGPDKWYTAYVPLVVARKLPPVFDPFVHLRLPATSNPELWSGVSAPRRRASYYQPVPQFQDELRVFRITRAFAFNIFSGIASYPDEIFEGTASVPDEDH